MSAWWSRVPSVYARTEVQRGTRWIVFSVLLLFMLVTFVTMLFHEPWRDEAFVWLMARDLSLPQLFHEIRYNGSPGLWHVLVFLLTHLGLPYISQQVLHWMVACTAAYVFLTRSPFHIIPKTLFLCTFIILYEHAVVVRVYAISLLLLYAVCAQWEQREKQPLLYGCTVALLANSNFFGLVSAAFFCSEFLIRAIQRSRFSIVTFFALGIMCVGGIVSYASIRAPADALFYYRDNFSFFHPNNFLLGLQYAFLTPNNVSPLVTIIASYFGAMTFLITVIFLLRRRAYAAMSFVIFLWAMVFYILVFKYIWMTPRHAAFFLIALLLGLWIAGVPKPKPWFIERVLFLLLSSSFLCLSWAACTAIRHDLTGPFSGGTAMANYIHAHHLEDRIIVGYSLRQSTTVLPYLPTLKLWSPEEFGFRTFVHFDSDARNTFSLLKRLRSGRQDLGDPSQLLFLFDSPQEPELMTHLQILYAAPGERESLWLFGVQPGQEETMRQLLDTEE